MVHLVANKLAANELITWHLTRFQKCHHGGVGCSDRHTGEQGLTDRCGVSPSILYTG